MFVMTAMIKTKSSMRSSERRMVKIPYKHQLQVKPPYYKALWYNCNQCKIHFMSEQAHLTAYLCNDCFNSMPHYRMKKPMKSKNVKRAEERWKELSDLDWPFEYILLYILGCSLCLLTIAYYLWFK